MRYHLLPKFLQIELTYACNSRCAFCYNPTHKKRDPSLTLDVLQAVNEYQLSHVQLIGGEVTTLPELPDYLDALSDAKHRSIVTNGRIFRPDIEGKVEEVFLSLHGEKKLHEELTGAIGSFETILETATRYVEWGIRVNSDTVLTKYNFDKVFDIASRAKAIGMDMLFLNIFQPEGIGSNRPDFSPSLEQIRSAITQLIRARDELELKVSFGTSTPFCLDERLITEQLAFRCGAGEWFASVDPTGELRICNHSTKSYGNVTKAPLGQIWHNKKIDSDYRNQPTFINGKCENCSFANDCLGGCRIDSSGTYRLDPIVARDFQSLLPISTMSSLHNTYIEEPFPLSYT